MNLKTLGLESSRSFLLFQSNSHGSVIVQRTTPWKKKTLEKKLVFGVYTSKTMFMENMLAGF